MPLVGQTIAFRVCQPNRARQATKNDRLPHSTRLARLTSPHSAQFRRHSGRLAAHDGGVDLGEEVCHRRLPFLVQDQKIHGAVPPRDIDAKADSESKDGSAGSLGLPIRRTWAMRWYFDPCGRSSAPIRSGCRLARPNPGRSGPRTRRLSKPDAVLSGVSGNGRGDPGCHAPAAAVGKSGVATVTHAILGDGNRPSRKLRIARSVHQGFPKGVRRFTEPISPYGGDIHSPARGERNSSPFR
jgi:hypothetical protein